MATDDVLPTRGSRRHRYGLPVVEGKEPQRVEKPWGHEVWWAHTASYAGKLLIVNAGHALSLQYHREKDETSYLLSGKLRLVQGESADALPSGRSSRGKTGATSTVSSIPSRP